MEMITDPKANIITKLQTLSAIGPCKSAEVAEATKNKETKNHEHHHHAR